jgi:hypothetical protein
MMSPIHPAPTLDEFDGGPPVDRKSSSGSSMTNGSHRNADDNEYYNGDDFDDMIAGAIKPTRRGQQHRADEYENNYEQDNHYQGSMVDTTPDENVNSDLEDEVASLNSDDISGGSSVSDVENQQRKEQREFVARPLINDDESTVDMRPPAPVNQSVSSYVDALNQQQTRKNRIVRAGMVFVLLGILVGVVLGIVSVTGNNKGGTNEPNESVDGSSSGGGGNGLGSNQIETKESFLGNATSYSPSLSPVSFDAAITSSPFTEDPSAPTRNPTLPPQSALPTVRPTPFPVEIVVTDSPVASTSSPVTPEPTPEPTPSPVTDEPTYEPSPMPSPGPTFAPITPRPTPNPTPKPFVITSPPTPRPTPRPVTSVIPPSGQSGPTLHAGGGSPSDGSFHCAEVTYTANWNELVDIDCDLVCSGLGMNSECPSGNQCRSDEGRCL